MPDGWLDRGKKQQLLREDWVRFRPATKEGVSDFNRH